MTSRCERWAERMSNFWLQQETKVERAGGQRHESTLAGRREAVLRGWRKGAGDFMARGLAVNAGSQ